jgi:hypothetical protein
MARGLNGRTIPLLGAASLLPMDMTRETPFDEQLLKRALNLISFISSVIIKPQIRNCHLFFRFIYEL